ncbi:SPOSA6832_04083, partial [Sporobolomyces salmonicolor]
MFAALRPATRIGARAFSTTRPAARDLAKMTLIGRIGSIDVREDKTGKPYLMYKVATTDKGSPPKEGEEYQRPPTSWHTIFARGNAVERLSFLEKGALVYVEASFTVRNEKDEAGNYKTEIFAEHERMTVLQRPKREEEQQ